MIIYFSTASSRFLTVSNFENLVRNLAAVALLALGQAFVLLLGQIDISAGAIVGLTTVTTTLAVRDLGEGGLVVAPLTGAAVGVINGLIVAKFNIHSVIVTIGTATLFRGVALSITEGRPVSGDFPDAFLWIGVGKLGPLPAPFVIVVIAFVLATVLLRYTRFGPMLYATGGNEEAARLAGLNVFRIKVIAFALAGIMAGFGGIYLASRINSGQPNLGAGLELHAIAAAVVGGMALTGGKGTIGGVALGVLVLSVLQNGLDITNVSGFTQQVLTGIVILGAVIADRLRYRS